MDNYVVSRELAEKLKSAGYPQETQFYWFPAGGQYVLSVSMSSLEGASFYPPKPEEVKFWSSAPLSDELLEQLPETIRNHEHGFVWRLEMKRLGRGVTVAYSNQPWVRDNKSVLKRRGFEDLDIENMNIAGEPYYSDKPADALAELYLWCRENGYV